MDRSTELALKRSVRDGLALRMQGSADPAGAEGVIASLVEETARSWDIAAAGDELALLTSIR